jgi:hypothetical protein
MSMIREFSAYTVKICLKPTHMDNKNHFTNKLLCTGDPDLNKKSYHGGLRLGRTALLMPNRSELVVM